MEAIQCTGDNCLICKIFEDTTNKCEEKEFCPYCSKELGGDKFDSVKVRCKNPQCRSKE